MTEIKASHIELTVTKHDKPATIYGAGEPRLDYSLVGKTRFYVDVVETDEGIIPMWDGASYEEGILAAEDLARQFGVSVEDRVVPGELA